MKKFKIVFSAFTVRGSQSGDLKLEAPRAKENRVNHDPRFYKSFLFSALATVGLSLFLPMTSVVAEPSDKACEARKNNSAEKLVECIRKDALWQHMINFQAIGDANPGPDGHSSRNSGEPGYLASVNYVANIMRKAGYKVSIQTYPFNYGVYTSVPVMKQLSPTATNYVPGVDWTPVSPSQLSGTTHSVTAQIQAVGGIVIPATPTPTSQSGCSAADFVGFVPGRIALIQRGTCNFSVKVANAQAAGASGVIIFNEGNPGRTGTGAGTLGSLISTIPVDVYSSFAVGANLYAQSLAGPTIITMNENVLNETRPDYNLIADSRFGDPNHIVVVDAHLDAIYGNGMLDNASGSSTILEVALKMKNTPTRNKLRFFWTGGEELGILGSFYYTENLSADELSKIVFDIDADVTATPNYIVAIANPANSPNAPDFPPNVVPASELGNQYFRDYFNANGLPFVEFSNNGTDSFAFAFAGVPNTGILTGQDCCKTQDLVDIFGGYLGNYEGNIPSFDGGFVDRPFLWGDNLNNNDPNVLESTSKAFAYVVHKLANDVSLNPKAKHPHHGDKDSVKKDVEKKHKHKGDSDN